LGRLESMQLKRSELNLLIMDYLMAEGFKEAAERFKCEANIDAEKINEMVGIRETNEQIDERISVRMAIEDGRIREAMKTHQRLLPGAHRQQPEPVFQTTATTTH